MQMHFTFPEDKWKFISKEAKDLLCHMLVPEKNRYNAEKPEVDSEFRSKEKYLIDNRWKNSFSLEEYQQFFMKNLKGKGSFVQLCLGKSQS